MIQIPPRMCTIVYISKTLLFKILEEKVNERYSLDNSWYSKRLT